MFPGHKAPAESWSDLFVNSLGTNLFRVGLNSLHTFESDGTKGKITCLGGLFTRSCVGKRVFPGVAIFLDTVDWNSLVKLHVCSHWSNITSGS